VLLDSFLGVLKILLSAPIAPPAKIIPQIAIIIFLIGILPD
jgi:hypothetical protein